VQIDTSPIDRYLRALDEHHGTDLLVTAGAPFLVRIDGELCTLDGPPLAAADTELVVRSVLGPDLWAQFLREKELDFSFDWADVARFRANAFHQRGTVAMALRLIPLAIPSFDELGIPPIVSEWVDRPQGLVLVTGPTGSGKSTTLASMIDAINTRHARHIITIEDPIEYVHRHKRSAVNQREIGVDCDSFDRALRSALREDPDVLLIGEMRDPETIQAALTIAETGHLVFATLHTNDAGQALDRIIDVFSGDRQSQIRVQLSGSLTGIMSQRLLPRTGGGRVAAFEVLVATFAVRNLIREGKTTQLRNVVSTGAKHGMQTLEMSLADLLGHGEIEYEQAAAISLYPDEVTRAARLAQSAGGAVLVAE
jgi:twitching motility protein PilT